jgi:hypothetical protein
MMTAMEKNRKPKSGPISRGVDGGGKPPLRTAPMPLPSTHIRGIAGAMASSSSSSKPNGMRSKDPFS